MKAVSDPMEKVLSRLDAVKSHGRGHLARCPAHDDHNPSLSIREGDDGRVLVHCFAGCDARDVARAMGLTMGDLFLDPITPLPSNRQRPAAPQRPQPAAPKRRKRVKTVNHPDSENGSCPIATYRYCTADGATVRIKARYGQKDFRWFSPAQDGGWYMDKDESAPEVLYGTERLAIDANGVVHLSESEKDKDALQARDLLAVAAGGADNWHPAMADHLAGRDVAILTHNDEGGRAFTRRATADLVGVGAIVRDVRLPGLPEKGDVVDWLDGGGTAERLIAFVAATAPYEPDNEEAGNDATPRVFTTYGPDELKAMPPLAFRIEGWIPENGLVEIVGKSGDMKTFYTLDMAYSIATDRIWNGCDVRGGTVIYIAGEGRSGMGQRITAWETARHATIDSQRFRLITDAPQMLTSEHVDALIATAKQWSAEVVVLDTLARTMDGDENSTKDMSTYVTACGRIQHETGATVVVVHHMGWSAERGRGSSALFAAIDAEITVVKDGDTVTARITKAKDFPGGAEMTFTPRVVELESGGTSVVLDRTDASGAEMTGAAKRVGTILWETFGENGATNTEWEGVCKEHGIAGKSFFHARTVLDKGGFVLGPDGYKRGHHYTITDAFAPFLTRHETPESGENPQKPWKPSFFPGIAGNRKTPAEGVFHENPTPPPHNTREGFQGLRSESPDITGDFPEGGEGFPKVPKPSEGVRNLKVARFPPPLRGKPCHLRFHLPCVVSLKATTMPTTRPITNDFGNGSSA